MNKTFDKLNIQRESYVITGDSYELEISKSEEIDDIYYSPISISRITSFCYAYSVGQRELYEPFLAETVDWVNQALSKEQDNTRDRCYEHKTLALLHWLQHNQDNVSLWKNTLEAYNFWYFDDKNPTDYSVCPSINVELFCEYLQACLFAQDYARGISVYEHYKGDKLKLTARLGQLALMYAYLRHFAYGEFTLAQIEKTAHNTLPKRLKECYNRGWFKSGTLWLKTVCHARTHHGADYTAEQVILTLYEYLDEEEKPEFVAELEQRLPEFVV